MTYKGPPVHAGEFMAAMKYAEKRLGLLYRGKLFEYTQVTSSKSVKASSGRWFYIVTKTGERWSWWASYRSGRGLITQVVGPKGEWNPQALKSQRHECGHLVLHSHGIKADVHHDMLKRKGLDYARS